MSLRDLPSVDQLLHSEESSPLLQRFGRPLTTQALRHELERARGRIRRGDPSPSNHGLITSALQTLELWTRPHLKPVINATGVVLHTNLGRAPLSRASIEAMQAVGGQYSNLEFDLDQGGRGHRDQHVESLLTRITGAQAALAVNNNAAAVLLALTALAEDQEALISRTQLIEIGGGFRIPEVLAQSGARLVEVGTTNRTHLHDYEAALSEETGVILRAHHSNFQIIGFTTEPSLAELADLAGRAGVPLVDDLGSGTFLDTAEFGLAHEPMVQESLQQGASVVTFSGDKLLGGPQAGLICGEQEVVERLRRHPLARAVRPDKLCLAGLNTTLLHYLKGEATDEIPIWRMISADPETLRQRAEAWAAELDAGGVEEGRSTVGGGSLPGESLPTWVWAYPAADPQEFVRRLRSSDPPLVARIEDDSVLLDPRTVLPGQDPDLIEIVHSTLEASSES